MIITKDGDKFYDLKKKEIKDASILEYIRKLVIPPAYKDVRIFYENNPKIMYEGYDAAGRLQQKYSPAWRTKADKAKFKKLIKFGEYLPHIYKHVDQSLQIKTPTMSKCIAVLIKIKSICHFRLGNEKYEKLYSSHGISTIQKKHIYIKDKKIHIKFIGKKGMLNECFITEPGLVKIITDFVANKDANDYVFTYTSPEGEKRIKATDVNDFLKKYDPEFTSKMFRTFSTNTLLIDFLRNREKPSELKESQRKKNIREAMREISKTINNTEAICKKSYANEFLMSMYVEHPTQFARMFFGKSKKTARELFIDFLKKL